jgi:hypothetical protein
MYSPVGSNNGGSNQSHGQNVVSQELGGEWQAGGTQKIVLFFSDNWEFY